MTDRKYAPSGALFVPKRKGDKVPDYSGTLEISKELLKELIEQANRDEPIKMDLAAYKNEHPSYGPWLKLFAKKPWVQTNGRTDNGKPRNDKPPF